MPTTPFTVAACLVAALCVLPAQAADTPSNMPEPEVATTVADPLRTARDAIAARQWDKALDLLQAQQARLGRNADLHNLLGYVHRKKIPPDLDKAFEHYRQALDIDPGHKGAHEYIGEAYLMRKQPAKAREHLQTLQRLCGNTTCEEYQDLALALAAYRD
jgi:tetratricopeptide (TPR) repeat protein